MAARPAFILDVSELQAEMRRILPYSIGAPKRSQTYRDVRAENQARFDAAMQGRQRPTRVS